MTISEDQNTIKRYGVVYLAQKANNDSMSHCNGCDLKYEKISCYGIPCAGVDRKDKERKIFKLK